MSNESKRHHYVPQFYLKQWTSGADNQLWRYVRVQSGTLHEKRVPPRATGYENELYSAVDPVMGRDLQRADSIETDFFKQLDTDASRVHQKLLQSNDELTHDERRAWALFLSSLLQRDPVSVAERRGNAAKVADELLASTLARVGQEERAEYEATLKEQWDERIDYLAANQMVVQIKDESVVGRLSSCEWRLTNLPEPLEFITSDLPLMICGASPQKVMALALSPKRLFICHRKDRNLDEETIAATMVAYNLALASGRGQVLYSRSQLVDGPTFRCRAIAEEHFGVRT